jgi:predicted metalloendopeptidase
MNQDMIEEKSISPLYPLFRSIREFIPLNANNHEVKGGINKAIQYLSEKNIWPLFELKVEPDIITNPLKPSLVLSQGQVGLHDTAMYEDPDTMRVYMQVVTSLLDVIFKKDVDNEFGWRSWSTIATARRIIEFEKKIVSSFTTKDHQPELWTLEELVEKLPQIHWTELLSVQPTHVLIPHSSFIDNLNQDILSEVNPRTLQMYFIWRIIWHHLSVLGQEMTAPKRMLDAKTSGIEPRSTPERWETCIDMLDKSALGILLGRYYVNDHDIVHAKKVVQDVAQDIVELLVKRVPDLPWATDRDKQEIIEKLHTIEFQVGYSNSQPDIQSVISLSEYFGDINMNPNDFFGNMMKSNKLQVKQHVWHALEEPTRNKPTWNPQSTRVSYNKELNQVRKKVFFICIYKSTYIFFIQ